MGIFRQFPYSNFHDMNMDQIIKIMREMQDEWTATKEEWTSYKNFIDNYFANLDVSEEVLQALQSMAASGELNRIIDPVIASETAEWLTEHLAPTSPPVDNTLTVSGAAADAKAAGDRIVHVQNALQILNDYNDESLDLTWELGALASDTGLPVSNRAYTRSPNYYNIDVIDSIRVVNNSVGVILISMYHYVNGAYIDRPIANYGISVGNSHTWDISNITGDVKFTIHKSGNPDITIPEMDGISVNYVTGLSGIVKYGRDLIAADLFNNMTENGIYGGSNAIVSQIADAPSKYGGFLIVLKSQPQYNPTQIYLPNNQDLHFYWRYSLSTPWYAINKENIGTAGPLTSDMLFSDIVASGVYGITNAIAAAIEDCPSDYGGNLMVFRQAVGSTPCQVYWTNDSDKYWYMRYNVTGIWHKMSKGLTAFEEQNTEYFVQTCINKPFTLSSSTRIALFSDSIGTSTHGGFSWASLVVQKIGCHISNFSVGGAAFVAPQGETSIIDEINGVTNWENFNTVIVAAGTNDAAYGTTAADLKTAISNIITAIRSHLPNAPIIFITPIQRNDYNNFKLPAIAGAICNIALQNECSVINGFDFPIATHSNDWITDFTDNDGLHPNANGKHVYAQSLLNVLL